MRNLAYALLAVMFVSIAAVSGVYAFGGNALWGPAGNEEAQEALEAGDYDAFITALSVTKEQVAERITQERFESMTERYRAREAVREALQNGDYQAWVTAVEQAQPPKITDIITEENFGSFAAMQEALQNGDLETAQQLAEELGLNSFGMRGKFHMGCPGMRGQA